MTTIIARCGRCPAKWSDPDACHCTRCHRTWLSEATYDRHLSNGQCVAVAISKR